MGSTSPNNIRCSKDDQQVVRSMGNSKIANISMNRTKEAMDYAIENRLMEAEKHVLIAGCAKSMRLGTSVESEEPS